MIGVALLKGDRIEWGIALPFPEIYEKIIISVTLSESPNFHFQWLLPIVFVLNKHIAS